MKESQSGQVEGCQESPTPPETAQLLKALDELGLEPDSSSPLRALHALLQPAKGRDGQKFLMKYYLPAPVGCGPKDQGHQWSGPQNEASFYRFLDVVDRDRCFINVPRLVFTDQKEHPQWILFEGIEGVLSVKDQEIRPDWFLSTLRSLRQFPSHLANGRRGLHLERWDPLTHREVIFGLREIVEPKVGPKAWDMLVRTLNEAREWTTSNDSVLVSGWFQDETLLLDEMGRIYLHDFRRVGLGSEDLDFGWFWIHNQRDPEWRKRFFQMYTSNLGTSEKYRVEWAARSVALYTACLKIAFAGEEDEISPSLELLERGIMGGTLLFP